MKRFTFLFFITLTIQIYSQEITQDTIHIDEVVIEANKSKISLQKIPVSTSYLSANTIDKLAINDMADLNGFVPNLFIPDYGSKYNSPIFIRGIGSRINEPSVGLYVDNIPYFDKGTFNFDFFYIKKIEVLRGPQGTLYGRNTMGGLVKIYTPNPQFNTNASFKINYGSAYQEKGEIHFNHKINNKAAFLADAAYINNAGFFTNQFDGQKADASETFAGRFKFLLKPSNRLQTHISFSYEKNTQDGYPYAVYDTESQAATYVNYNHPSNYQRDLLSLGMYTKYSLNKMDITFSGSYQYLDDIQDLDQDFTADDIYIVLQERNKNSFVEELNIKSKASAKIQWIGGLFLFQNSSDKEVGVDLVPYHMNLFKTYDQPTNGFASFGQVIIPFSDFELTAGLRYDHEEASLDYTYDRTLGGITGNVSNLNLSLSFDELLPKASLRIIPIEQFSMYLSFAKGYKAGGFNSTIEREEDETYKPEYSLNYELGFKYQNIDKTITANATAYYIDWKDQQITQSVPSGRGLMLKNAGKSESYGIEIETNYQPVKNLTLSLAYGTTTATFKEYKRDESTNYKGNVIPYVPAYTLNTILNYKLNLHKSRFKSVLFNIAYNHFGKLYWDDNNIDYQNSYGLLNTTIASHFNKVSFGVWGKNLLDTNYNTFYFNVASLNKSFVQLGNPLQIGGFIKYTIN